MLITLVDSWGFKCTLKPINIKELNFVRFPVPNYADSFVVFDLESLSEAIVYAASFFVISASGISLDKGDHWLQCNWVCLSQNTRNRDL